MIGASQQQQQQQHQHPHNWNSPDQPQPQPQTVWVQIPQNVPSQRRICCTYKCNCMAFGIAQIILGLFVIVLGCMAYKMDLLAGYGGGAIWCGLIFIVPGVLAILTANYTRNVLIVASIVFSVPIAVVSIGYLLSVISLVSAVDTDQENFKPTTYTLKQMYAVDSSLIVVAVAEGVIATLFLITSCRMLWCGQQSPNAPAYYVAGQPCALQPQEDTQMVTPAEEQTTLTRNNEELYVMLPPENDVACASSAIETINNEALYVMLPPEKDKISSSPPERQTMKPSSLKSERNGARRHPNIKSPQNTKYEKEFNVYN